MRYLDDTYLKFDCISLLCSRVTHHRIPFPIENVLGGGGGVKVAPPNSCTHQASTRAINH